MASQSNGAARLGEEILQTVIMGNPNKALSPLIRIELHHTELVYELAMRLELPIEIVGPVGEQIDFLKTNLRFNEGDL